MTLPKHSYSSVEILCGMAHPSCAAQWIGFVGTIETRKPHDFNGKIMEHRWFPVQIFPTKPIKTESPVA